MGILSVWSKGKSSAEWLAEHEAHEWYTLYASLGPDEYWDVEVGAQWQSAILECSERMK